MTKQQAATVLGVTRRTVERYLAAGKLPYEKVESSPGRWVDDIPEAEVLALRAARERDQAAREQRVVSPVAMQHVSFRMEADYLQRLDEAAAAKGLNRSEYARQLLCEALTREQLRAGELQAVLAQLGQLVEGVGRIRHDLGEALFSVLVLGVKADEAQARQWIGERFGTEA